MARPLTILCAALAVPLCSCAAHGPKSQSTMLVAYDIDPFCAVVNIRVLSGETADSTLVQVTEIVSKPLGPPRDLISNGPLEFISEDEYRRQLALLGPRPKEPIVIGRMVKDPGTNDLGQLRCFMNETGSVVKADLIHYHGTSNEVHELAITDGTIEPIYNSEVQVIIED